MKEVNADLFEFLSNHETGMYYQYNNVTAYVFIDFGDAQEFTNIVGNGWFDEGGVDCKLQENGLCVEINDFIEGEGHLLSSYENCFSEQDWKEHKEKILELES